MIWMASMFIVACLAIATAPIWLRIMWFAVRYLLAPAVTCFCAAIACVSGHAPGLQYTCALLTCAFAMLTYFSWGMDDII